MAGDAEANGPMYISLRSAEVILSDIRPIKLKIEALRSVNVFLDEFLFNILNAARSLTTEKLREGLLKVLPTALGKEALLEAEVELRAWERANPRGSEASRIDDGKEFGLQWAFELLRLKCEAYSTLNDSDEDADAEKRLHDRMAQVGSLSPPKPTLVAPASLYLTAILEAICEHILSNVGRVAARDSSRTSATVGDLFVGLCEDDSIYGLFKSMKVYEQIENLSTLPKTRRSKSISRTSERAPSITRTSSPSHEISTNPRDSSLPARSRSRISSESSGVMATTATTGTASTSRSSFEKSRAMKMFIANSRSSGEQTNGGLSESFGSHKKSDSILSDGTRQTSSYTDGQRGSTSIDVEDEGMLEEFDNAMRSGPTMKMSLTPDRLKTMEVYNKEKGERAGNRRAVPKPINRSNSRPGEQKSFDLSLMPPSPELAARTNGGAPPLRHVDSIVEDEEDGGPRAPAPTRPRQLSVATGGSKAATTTRTRSVSASTPPVANRGLLARKPSQEVKSSTPQKRERHIPKQLDTSATVPRTRRVARNRESLDLDEVMGASDDDDPAIDVAEAPRSTSRGPSSTVSTPHAVSNSTRELMDFLATGPPEEPSPSKSASVVSFDTPSKPNRGGRLQRMISKWRLGDSGERQQSKTNNGAIDDASLSRRLGNTPMTSPVRPILTTKYSSGSITLANKPVPPRPPPPPISPPSSSQGSLEDPISSTSSSRQSRKAVPALEQNSLSPKVSSIRAGSAQDTESYRPSPSPTSPPSSNGHAQRNLTKEEGSLQPSLSRTSRAVDTRPSASSLKPPEQSAVKRPTTAPTSNTDLIATTLPSAEDARDIRRLLARATTADECRVLMDMFLAKFGLPAETTDFSNPYPSPTSDNAQRRPSADDDVLEYSLVELLLGGHGDRTPHTQDSVVKSVPAALASPPDTPNPSSGKSVTPDTPTPASTKV